MPPSAHARSQALANIDEEVSDLARVPKPLNILVWVATALAAGAVFPTSLPEIVVDPTKTMSAENMKTWGLSKRFSRWSPVFRVDVLDSALATDGGKWLAHDGLTIPADPPA